MSMTQPIESMRPTVEFVVLGRIASGKTTLINSMLGREILPARVEATTARVAKIHDEQGREGFRAVAHDAKGNLLETIDPLTLDGMNRLNDMSEASMVDIYGAIPGIESRDVSLILTETLGLNNSQAPEHLKYTYDLFNSEWTPMILYVLDYGHLGMFDDLLDVVTSIAKCGDRQVHDRFLFVLNKADEFDFDRGENVARTIENTIKCLKSHGIPNPRVMPTSARLAKLIRQKRNGDTTMTSREERMLMVDCSMFVEDSRYHFTDYAQFLSPATETALKERIAKARAENNQEELALLYSGVPSIEMAISEYLTSFQFTL